SLGLSSNIKVTFCIFRNSPEDADLKAQTPSNASSSFMALKADLCTKCGKTFESKSALKTLQKSHSVQRPYGCSTCGKQYTKQQELHLHQRLIIRMRG
ncbi:hypothetical protein QTP86_027352, partial [Hemibagrus guttatus]